MASASRQLCLPHHWQQWGSHQAFTKHVDMYIPSIWDRLRTTLWETQALSMAEAHRHKSYYNRKIGAVNLKSGDLVLVKADAWKGKRKIRDRWEEETWEVVHQIAADIPSYEVTNQHEPSTKTDFFSSHQRLAFPCVWAASIHRTGVLAPPYARLPLWEVEKKRMPQEENRKAVTQWPTSKVSLR